MFKKRSFLLGIVTLPVLLVGGEENFFEVDEIEDLNSHISAWSQDPYYAAIYEDSLDEIICLAD